MDLHKINKRGVCVALNFSMVLFGIVCSSCQSSRITQAPLLRIDKKRQFSGVLKIEKDSLLSMPKRVRVSKKFLSLYLIKSAYVSVRKGPGTKFPIGDELLNYDEKTIVFDSIGKWKKILAPRLNIRGWVHQGHLTRYKEDDKTDLELRTKNMPIVSATRNIKRIYLYGSEDGVDVKIPFSSQFIYLKQSPRRVLVWLPNINTVAWIDKSALI